MNDTFEGIGPTDAGDEYSADEMPAPANLLIADLTAGRVTLGDGRRKSKRLTIAEQDKLHAEIGRLRARVFWAFVLGCFVGFVVGGIAGRIF